MLLSRKTIAVFCLLITLTASLSSSIAYSKAKPEKIIKKATRSDSYFAKQDLKAAIIWAATPVTDTIVDAMVAKRAQTFKLGEFDQATIQKEILEKRKGQVLFHISFYCGDRKSNNLANAKAKWDLRLTANGNTYEASLIEKTPDFSPIDSLYFRPFNEWTHGYYVWFPIPVSDLAEPYSLEVRGVLGHATLSWN